MRRLLHILVAFTLLSPALRSSAAEPKKVIVCTVTTGFRHSSIATAEKTLEKLAAESKAFTIAAFVRQPAIEVPRKPNQPRALPPEADAKARERFAKDMVKYEAELAKWTPEVDQRAKAAQAQLDAGIKQALEALSPSNLASQGIDAVIFANTTGDLPLPDPAGFIRWIEEGHGFIGMHSASDTFHRFDPYLEMLGGEFNGHGAQVPADLVAGDTAHPANGGIGAAWNLGQEEMYRIKRQDRGKVHSLWFLEHDAQKPDEKMFFPVSWCRRAEKGRVFYTSLGHREDLWSDDAEMKDRKNSVEVSRQYQAHILGGIRWALGLSEGSAEPDYQPLFNGRDFAGWHVRKPEAHNAWKVENGVLRNELAAGEHGVDLVTDRKFWNFAVHYEYLVPDGSNSGFYLRGRHEIQILGDAKSGRPALNGNGAIYNHTAPSQFVSKPADQWQTVDATIIGDKITVVLNGVKIHDGVVCDRATGSELDKDVNEPGALFLQGDHGTVSFRNLSIKELPKQ